MIESNSRLHEQYAYTQLAKINQGNITLTKQGLDIIENVLTGQLALIAIQGEPTILFRKYIYELSKLQISPYMNNNSSVWISSNPYTEKGWKKQFFILQTISKTKEDALKIHLFVSAISTVILLNITDKTNLQFLYSLNGRMVVSQQLTMSIKNHVGSLYILIRENLQYDRLEDRSRKFFSILQEQKIQDYVKNNYEIMETFVFSDDSLLTKKHYLLLNSIIKQFEETLVIKATSGLMFGPILVEYIKIIVQQINKFGMVDLEKAEDQIQLGDGYQAHNQVVKQYTLQMKSALQPRQNQPIPNLNDILKEKKQKAIQRYLEKCDDIKYLGKVQQYIEKNQQQVKKINNELCSKYNWDLLEKQSQNLVGKMKSSNNKSPAFVKKQVDGIVSRYQSKALGNDKYQILTDYLNKFVPSLIEQPTINKADIQSKYNTLKAQNKNLKKLIEQHQKKKEKGKNGCCILM